MIDTYTPTIIKDVATRIDLLRTEQNLSMCDLAKKFGISKSQLSDIILGNKIQTSIPCTSSAPPSASPSRISSTLTMQLSACEAKKPSSLKSTVSYPRCRKIH